MSSENPYEFLDFDIEESKAAEEKLSVIGRRLDRDGRICACGHPMARHATYSGIVYCKPSRMECLCKTARPVLEAEDVRDFLRKTVGSGPLHALGRGILSSIEKGHKVEWIVSMVCDRCGTEGRISPVSVTQHGIEARESTGYDALLCQKCREEI
jgi:hypothetical protein